jgi:hypothetical protein
MVGYGVLYASMSWFAGVVSALWAWDALLVDARSEPLFADAPSDAAFTAFVMVAHAAVAIVLLAIGPRVSACRGRGLALLALASTMLTAFSLWCTAFSIPLVVYGLVVLFQRDVVRAFERVRLGVGLRAV